MVGVGAHDAHAIVLTGAYFKIENNGRFDGGSLAALNNIQDAQHGLVLGLVNYARELHGAQVGVINISDNGGGRRVLPILRFGSLSSGRRRRRGRRGARIISSRFVTRRQECLVEIVDHFVLRHWLAPRGARAIWFTAP